MATRFLHKRGPARRVALWTLGAFLAVQLVVNLVIDGWRPDLRSSHLALVLDQMDSYSGALGVVCLGTSRFGMAIEAPRAERALRRATGDRSVELFNASVPSGDYDTSDYLLRKMLGRGLRPGLVVIELCPEMVNRRNRLFGAHVLPSPDGQNLPTYLGDLWQSRNVRRLVVERILPVYRYRRALRGAIATVVGTDLAALWWGPDAGPGAEAGSEEQEQGTKRTPTREELFLDGRPTQTPLERTQENLPRVRDWLADYRVGGTTCVALERLLRRCRAYHMTVVLVAPPVSGAQRALYTLEIEAVFLGYVRQLAGKYQCRFIDYRARLADDLFYDNHHVLPAGGKVFCRELTRDVLVPCWREVLRTRIGATQHASTQSPPQQASAQ